MPEMLDDENIPEVFEALKKSGKSVFQLFPCTTM